MNGTQGAGNVEEILAVLGYPEEWHASGFIATEFLLAQFAAFTARIDRHTEHFRFTAFARVLDRRDLPDEIVEQYLRLASLDPDAMMARSAMQLLLEHPALSNEQFERSVRHPRLHPRLERRHRLLRALRTGPPSAEVLGQCLVHGDAAVHEALLRREDLADVVLEGLVTRGASRRVRGMAKAALGARRGANAATHR